MTGKGIRLALIGLALGMLVGFGLKQLKTWAAHELIGILESEVSDSCDCELVYDSVDISLMALTATAVNVRLMSEGQPRLTFEKVHALFSLSRLLEKRIILSELQLINGFAKGVGPDSPTYLFVDHLTAPIPPERDRPGRWRLLLQALRLKNTGFEEDFPRSHLQLAGTGGNFLMRRNAEDDFEMQPTLDRLEVRPLDKSRSFTPILLGKVEGDVTIKDETVDFERVRLILESTWAQIDAISRSKLDNLLTGSLTYSIDSRSIGIEPDFRGRIHGTSELSGSLGNPKLTSVLESHADPEERLQYWNGDLLILDLDRVDGKFDFDLNHGRPQATMYELSGDGPNGSLSLAEPLKLDDGALTSAFRVEIGSLSIGNVSAEEIDSTLRVSGPLDAPEISIAGKAARLTIGGVPITPFEFSAIEEGDRIKLNVADGGSGQGSFSADGYLARLPNMEWGIESMALQFDRFTYMPAAPSESPPEWIRLTGSAQISGPLDIGLVELAGTMDAELFGGLNVAGPVTLSGGVLTHMGESESKSVHSELRLDLIDRATSRLQIKADDLRFSEFDESMDCLQASFTSDYSFRTNAMLAGEGAIAMDGMVVGCPPYSLVLQPTNLRIRGGNVDLGGLRWQGMNSEFRARGNVSLLTGYDLSLEGTLPLSSLLSLLPSIDDLGGTLISELKVAGPLGNPKVDGFAALENAEVVLESADLDASKINGEIVLRGGSLQLDSLTGLLNGGKFDVTGTLNPFAFEESSFDLSVRDVVVEPASDTSIVLGGHLTLDRLKTEKPSIHGEIRIESGEFEKNISLVTILRAIRNYIFASERTVLPPASMPNINLDVSIAAPRNLLVSTNWLVAELKADLHIGGTLASPILRGQLETLSGWFGIKDRRFDITSGRVTFRPGSLDPEIEIIGEATIRTAAGDSNLVIVEITGPLSAPNTRLTSDSALSDKEILDLITIGTTSGGTFGSSALQDSTGIQEFPLIQEGSLLTYNEFLRNLTRIDSLAVGPSFNSQTGGIEPSVVARKNITRKLSLVGESSFGGTETESSLGAVYDLTSATKLSAGAESSSAKQNTAFEVDLTYTVLAPQLRFLEIRLEGNETFDKVELLDAIRLSENSRVPASEINRLRETIEKYYASEGFVDTKARVDCSERSGFCRSISISIEEGLPRFIRDIGFEGDDITQVIEESKLPDANENERASQKYLTDKEAAIVQALRSEGYIGARARGRYEIVPESRYADLIYDVHLGKPVSFTFRGNREFSAEDFLETINLFSRKQPFGPNTINILLENIERLYREKGYLFVSIHNERLEDSSGRVNYIVTITEEQKTPVSEVRIEGSDEVIARRIRRRLAQRYPSEAEGVLEPDYAVEETIAQNALLIREILLEEGYPGAIVEHVLDVPDSGRTVAIVYRFEPGEPFRAAKVNIEGMPEEIQVEALEPPYSIPKINRQVDALLLQLKGAGYLEPEINTILDAETTALTIRVQPGSLTYISDIILEGNVITKDSIIRRNLTFAVGEPWAETQLEQTRRKLLKLGLFSRVEIKPLDGDLDEKREELLIKLSERPLRTLNIGTGANSEYGFHLFAEGTDKKLFGDGKSLSLNLDGYYDPQDSEISQGLAALRYLNPYFFSSRFSHTEDLRFQRISTTTQEFDVDRISLASYLYRTLNGGRTFSFGHTGSQENLDNVPDDAVLSDLDTGVLNLSYISGRYDLDRRDAPLNPTSGYNLNLEYKLASEAIGSEASFQSFGSRFSYWHPLPFYRDRFYLANSTRLAAAWTLGDTEEIPITQRYYLGGRTTLRGFRENDLGPKGDEGSVLGGDTLFSNNLELRYRLGNSFEIHTFLDLGNVFLRERSLSGDDIRFSTGIGARYLSPIGPIGFDIAGPLDEKEGEPSIRFHFSVGAPF